MVKGIKVKVEMHVKFAMIELSEAVSEIVIYYSMPVFFCHMRWRN